MKPETRTGNDLTTSSPEDVVASLLYLYSLQTNEEQDSNTTKESNGVGFNSYDSSILSSIAESVSSTGTITDRQLDVVRYKLQRYRKQLVGIDLSKWRVSFKQVGFIPNATKNFVVKKKKTATALDGDTIKLEFGYDESLINRIKTLSGRKYNSQGKFWTCPASKRNINAIENMGFVCPPEFLQVGAHSTVDLDFSGLKMSLRPYQLRGATRAAEEFNLRALIADEMGLGKTAQAIAAIWSRRKEALPALVVCPGSLKWNWAREIAMWLPDVSVRILSGFTARTSYSTRSQNEITVINYDILTGKRGAKHGWSKLLSETGFKTIVLDESHKIKNYKAQRTKAITEMIDNIPNRLALSGTPIESRPMEFFTTLKVVSPNLFPNFWEYGTRYCGAISDAYGTKFTGASNLQELNDILTENIMIRRRKSDVLAELPPKVRSVTPVKIDMREYHKAENQLRSYLQRTQGLSAQETQAHVLAQMEKCKQAAIVGKLPFAINYIRDYLETGKKLVVFATHTFTLDALEKAFFQVTARVDGSVIGIKRQQEVDKFQNDDNCRLFLGNLQAAGVGLTLTTASDTLTLELGWTPGAHDQAEDRCFVAGTKVITPNGFVPIEKIKIGDKVFSGEGEIRNVTDAWSTEGVFDLVKIRPYGSSESFICTNDHNIKTGKGWKSAGDLSIREQLIGIPEGNEQRIVSKVAVPNECRHPGVQINNFGCEQKPGKLKRIPESFNLDKEFLFICGYYIGDGWCRLQPSFNGNKRRSGCLSFGGNLTTKREAIEKIAEWGRRLGFKSPVKTSRRHNGTQLNIGSYELAMFFQSQFGTGTDGKHFPEWFWELDQQQLQWFLSGLLCSDGYFIGNKKQNQFGYSSMSSVIASSVTWLLRRIGFSTNIRHKEGECYYIECTVTEDEKFPFRNNKIRTVEYLPDTKTTVYDITVEQDHSFVVENVVVHNCHRIGQEADSVNAYYMIATGTIENDIIELLDEKRKVLSRTLDGQEVSQTSLLKELTARVLARRD